MKDQESLCSKQMYLDGTIVCMVFLTASIGNEKQFELSLMIRTLKNR